jgi:hypothetical protein
MKTKKPIKSKITIFYQGGTKLKASLPLERGLVEAEMFAARKDNRDARLETVVEDETEDNSYLFITRNGLLFYNIYEPVEESTIQVVPASTLVK